MAWQDRAYNREDRDGGSIPPVSFRFPPLTRLVMSIMGICLFLFLFKAGGDRAYGGTIEWGALTFENGRAFTQPWRWITYQYLHGSGGHLFFNMLALYFFLPSLEAIWGWKRALAFYTMGGIFAGLMFGVLCLLLEIPVPLIGASGSVLAALGACALLFPERQLILLLFPVPIRVAAGLLGILYLLTVVGDRDLSNAAHLGGLAFGFFAPWWGGPALRRTLRQFSDYRERRETTSMHEEQEMVDRILAKVHEQGMNSLSWSERRALKKATERQQKRDLEAAARRKKY